MTQPQSSEQLKLKRCEPCEGGVQKLSQSEASAQCNQLDGWTLSEDSTSIHRKWVIKNFSEAMRFLNEVAKLAEAENHHPDLHLCGYRNVKIDISTHAIGGLSINDFILAAKIDALPVEEKKQSH